jgi:hypothetical protein
MALVSAVEHSVAFLQSLIITAVMLKTAVSETAKYISSAG